MVCRVTNTLTKESVLTDSFELTLTPVVKADLSAAIAAAEGKQEAGYTPETWEPFAEALEYAKAVLAIRRGAGSGRRSNEALTEKMAALAETAGTSSKPGDSSSKPDTSRPGDISSPDDSSSKGGTSQNGQNTPQTGDQFYPGVFIVLIGGCLLSSAAYVLIKTNAGIIRNFQKRSKFGTQK